MNQREIFLAALLKEDDRERAAYLKDACGKDVELRAEVEALLRNRDRLGDFLETPAPGLEELRACLADRGNAELPSGSHGSVDRPQSHILGDFRMLREIGCGGMGVVYEAEQISLDRRVALKVLPFAAMLDPRQLQRFKNEALAAAALDHPNIVHVYAVGCDRGVHYYAMQFVDGRTLAQLIAELRQVAEFERAADTPQHMSQPTAGLVTGRFGGSDGQASGDEPTHGLPSAPPAGSPAVDTKPEPQAAVSTKSPPRRAEFFRSVARLGIQAAEALEHAHQTGVVHRDVKPSNLMVDARGHLWITDFGLAMTHKDSALTMTGDILGTLRYMSPEQALGDRRQMDHRTDIYSLGVTLYEFLSLRPAFSGGQDTLIRRLSEEEPPRLRSIDPSIPQDLETIVLKAMSKEPAGRYASAGQLADDLKRFLAHEPIRARSPTLADWAAKWARRHRTVVHAAVAVLLIAVVLLSAAVLWVVSARNETQRQRDEAIAQERIAQGLRLEAEQREQVLREQLYAADVKTAYEGWRQARLEWVTGFLRDTQPDLRGFEWFYLFSLCHQDQRTLRGHQGEVCCVAYDRQGRNLASAAQDGTVRVWDVTTGQERGVLRVGREDQFHAAVFSPDGATLAATASGGRVKLFDVARLTEKPPLEPEPSSVHALAYSPDGRFLATGGSDGIVRLYDAATGKQQREIPGHKGDIATIAFSPDSRTLASGGADELTKVWDVANGKRLVEVRGHLNSVTCQTFSPDGNTLASVSADRRIILWNPATWKERLNLLGHTDRIHSVAYTPDGRTLVSCGKDGTIRVWDAADGKELNVLRGHVGRVRGVAISPDGRTLASAGADGTVKLWGFSAPQEHQVGPTSVRALLALAFAPDGTLVVCEDTQLAFWDVEACREVKPRVQYPAKIFAPAFSPDFGTLVAQDFDSEKQGLYSMTTGKLVAELPRSPDLDPRDHGTNPAFSQDGLVLATAWDMTVTIRELSSQSQPKVIRPPEAPTSIAFSPDGRTVAVGLRTGGVALLDPATGQWRAMLRGQADTESICCVRFSPDGTLLASSGVDHVIRLWDPATGEQLKNLVGHRDEVVALTFSPDGRTLASASDEQTVRLWRVASGRELLVLESPSKVVGLAFSPDGLTLAAGTWVPGRAAVYLWRGKSPPAEAGDEKNEQGAP